MAEQQFIWSNLEASADDVAERMLADPKFPCERTEPWKNTRTVLVPHGEDVIKDVSMHQDQDLPRMKEFGEGLLPEHQWFDKHLIVIVLHYRGKPERNLVSDTWEAAVPVMSWMIANYPDARYLMAHEAMGTDSFSVTHIDGVTRLHNKQMWWRGIPPEELGFTVPYVWAEGEDLDHDYGNIRI